ncbi:tetratricopeptide repeat protein [Roseibium sp.]|uniref:tetratricopeptide repeat protein n=1 Tax=Roseibium sp. TaxID=1936156 RepID=UPI003A96B815
MTRGNPVSGAEIRDALKRVLESEEFRSSPRIKDVLRYIVEKFLDGRPGDINETIIAYEVFNRRGDDPDSSGSVVRVTMARLRRKLSYYYQSAGTDDPIRIEITPGSYAPVFVRVGQDQTDAGGEAELPGTPMPGPANNGPVRRYRYLIAVLVLLVVASGFWIAESFLHEKHRRQYAAEPEPMPFVAVIGVDHEQNVGAFGRRFQMTLTSDLAKLSALRVMASGPGGSEQLLRMPLSEMASRFGLSHFVTGVHVLDEGGFELDVQLQETTTSEIVWAERYTGQMDDLDGLLEKVVDEIASALSVVVEPDEIKRIALGHSDNRTAVTLFSNAMRSLYPPDQVGRTRAAIDMLLEVTRLDPEFAGGYAGLSLAHAQLVLYRHSDDPDTDLKKAVDYARSAVEVDANYGFGHSALGYAYAVGGDRQKAVVESYRAVTLEPSDPITQMRFAAVLCLAGRHQEALRAINETLRLDPLKPRTPYRNLRGVILYNLGRYQEAAKSFDENVALDGPRATWIQLIHAMSHIQIGDEREALNLLNQVVGKFGNATPDYWLDIWLTAPGSAEDAKRKLSAIGWNDVSGDG